MENAQMEIWVVWAVRSRATAACGTGSARGGAADYVHFRSTSAASSQTLYVRLRMTVNSDCQPGSFTFIELRLTSH
jgi:hypothetical protein